MEDLRPGIEQVTERQIDRRHFLRRAMAIGLSLPAASAILAACAPAAPSPTSAPAKPAAPPPVAPTSAPAPAPTAVPKPAATAIPAAAAQPTAAPKPTAKVDIAKLVEGAKKEGGLVWIDAASVKPTEDALHAAFKKKYGLADSFKITHITKGTADVANTVEQEVKAGNVNIDVVWLGNAPFFEALKKGGHLLAHESDEAAALAEPVKKLNFPADPPHWFTAHSYGFVPVWNRKFVKKDIKSWLDLLDSELKGKITVGDLRTSSTMVDTWLGLKTVLPADYFQKLKSLTDPMVIARTPQRQQMILSGERPITNLQASSRVYQDWQGDKSLDFGVAFPTEGMVPLAISMGALAKAPHPNAARLWIEFLMSKEAQQLWLDLEAQWPLRADVTYSPDVLKFLPPLDKIKTITMTWDKITDKMRDDAKEEFRKTFGVD